MKTICLVGYGYWGKKIAAVLLKAGYLLDICDVNLEEIPKKSTELSWNNLLKQDTSKFVFLATPEETHFKLAMELIQKKKNVFVEKPLALQKSEVELLCKAALYNKTELFCDYIFLFDEYVKEIKNLIDSKRIGDLIKIESKRHSVGFHKTKIHVSDDLLIHDLYLGELFTKTYVKKAKQIRKDTFLLEFGNKITLDSWCSWQESIPKREMTVIGTKGKITWLKREGQKDLLNLEVMGEKSAIEVQSNVSALSESTHYFLNECAEENASQKKSRYDAYIRHVAMLESVREEDSTI